ncbi:MAG: CoA transferase subunit A [Candidatus Izimaplasma sp.]|nr:CoA transferase subunit A [Candidatus Izimaplasma bacterium]
MVKQLKLNALEEHLHDGMSILVGGFMCVGTPELIIDEIVKSNVKDLTIYCNDSGFEEQGVGKLIKNNQVKKLVASHIGLNPYAGKLMSSQEMDVELIPQGTLAERIRAGGSGLGGILTQTGINTIVEKNKQIINVNNQSYILETPIRADLAIIYGNKIDQYGNTMYRATTRNFNPVMAMAADKVIAQARHMVQQLDPECVHTPHIFVDYVIKEEDSD